MFDLLAVRGTLESLLLNYSLKASNLWCSAFLMFQLSYIFMTIGKTIALTIWTFVDAVVSLLFGGSNGKGISLHISAKVYMGTKRPVTISEKKNTEGL